MRQITFQLPDGTTYTCQPTDVYCVKPHPDLHNDRESVVLFYNRKPLKVLGDSKTNSDAVGDAFWNLPPKKESR